MEIQFTNIDNLWVAEFEVTSDFNLHLERDTEGRLDIYQRTAGGDYEYIYDIGYLNKRTVYDNDFQALVYPKWIKIKSAVKPLIATITTDGEVNEVVYQAKDIEITSNGTTKVTADTGYTALGSVNVKVNVPTEGGGSDVEADDVIWYMDVYTAFPMFNISKGTFTGAHPDEGFLQDVPLTNEMINLLHEAIAGVVDNGYQKIQITNLKAPIIHLNSDTQNLDMTPSLSGIKIEGSLLLSGNNIVNYKGTIGYGLAGGNAQGRWITYLDEENKNLLDVYSDSEILDYSVKKIIASNGNEIEMITTWFLSEENPQDIEKVFEDLFSQIAVKYENGERFDDSLELYGYADIRFANMTFTRVGAYSINQYNHDAIYIYLMSEEGSNPYDGWGLRKDADGYHLNYPG